MSYWYAGSTFEVLAEIGKAKVCADSKTSQKKCVWSWTCKASCVAYAGITQRSLTEAGNATSDTTRAGEDEFYQEQLVKVQGRLVAEYDSGQKKAWGEEELARLPAAERQAIEQNGWNVAQFLSIIQDMPTHETLFDKSTAREREALAVLEKVG